MPAVPVAAATVDSDHGERRDARRDGLRQTLFHATRHHPRRVLALAVQRDHAVAAAPVWPGGRAIAQFVGTPPRAAETNDPVT